MSIDIMLCDQCGDQLYDGDNYDPDGVGLRCNGCIKRIEEAVRKQYKEPAMDANGWRPISSAPKNTELLVGRFLNNGWHICQSGLYYDAGCPFEGETGYWYWSIDHDADSVTVDEGPSHWMPPSPAACTGGAREANSSLTTSSTSTKTSGNVHDAHRYFSKTHPRSQGDESEEGMLACQYIHCILVASHRRYTWRHHSPPCDSQTLTWPS